MAPIRTRSGQIPGGFRVDPLEQRVQAGIIHEQLDGVGAEGQTQGERGHHGRLELPIRPGQDRPRAVVVGPRGEQALGPCRFVGRIGCEDQRACRVGSRADGLREALPVVADEPDGSLDDRHRTAVVHLEVHAPKPGEHRIERQHAADVGEPPPVDRLVVVADEEDPVRRGREQQREPQLRAVHVLDLVHEQVGAAAAPRREQVRVRLERRERASDEVVEVERAASRQRALVGHERSRCRSGLRVRGDLVRRHREIQLEPRERGVESRRPPPGRCPGRAPRGPPRESTRPDTSTPASRRISRPSAWNVRTRIGLRGDAQRRHRGIESLAELLGGALVEGDRGEGARIHAAVHQPGHPGDEGRGLAAAGGRHAEHGTRGCGGRRPLVRRESLETGEDGRVHGHRRSLTSTTSPTVNRIPVRWRTARAAWMLTRRHTSVHRPIRLPAPVSSRRRRVGGRRTLDTVPRWTASRGGVSCVAPEPGPGP